MGVESWRSTSLGDIASVVTSGSRDWAKHYSDSGSKFIRMTNLPRDGIYLKLNDMKYVDVKSNSADGKRTSLIHGDILISITAELGKIGWIPQGFGEAYINQHTALVRIKKIEAVSKFIAYLLSSDMINRVINLGNDSGAKAGLNLPSVKSVPICVPPLPEQQKIAAILTSVDEVIEKTQAQIDKLKDLKTAMMQELLTKGIGIRKGDSYTSHVEFKDSPVGRIPKSWEVVTLEDLCDEHYPITYGVLKPGCYVEHGIPLLQIKDLANGTIQGHNLHLIGNELDFEYRRSRVKPGDVVISLVGTIGRVAIIPNWLTSPNIHRNLGRIRSKFSHYIFHYLQSETALSQLDLTSAGSSQSALNLSALRQIQLPFPKQDEMQKIVKILDSVQERTFSVERKLSKLQNTKKALMQDLLTGKVRVNVD